MRDISLFVILAYSSCLLLNKPATFRFPKKKISDISEKCFQKFLFFRQSCDFRFFRIFQKFQIVRKMFLALVCAFGNYRNFRNFLFRKSVRTSIVEISLDFQCMKVVRSFTLCKRDVIMSKIEVLRSAGEIIRHWPQRTDRYRFPES